MLSRAIGHSTGHAVRRGGSADAEYCTHPERRVSIVAACRAGILLFRSGLPTRLAAGPGEVTDWVQAIDSILAIVAGFGVAAYQVQKQREDSRGGGETRERAQAAHKLAFQAYRLIGERLATALLPRGQMASSFGCPALQPGGQSFP